METPNYLFVSYDVAKILKEKGFDELCLAYFIEPKGIFFMGNGHKIINAIPAPMYCQVKNWLRVNHQIDLYEKPLIGKEHLYICDPLREDFNTIRLEPQKTPEKALEKAFEYIFNIL